MTHRKLFRRFARNRHGSAAVEFALVAPLFFALLFAILETALVFFAGQSLETIAQNSARVVLTGQAQTGQLPACTPACTTTADQFKNYVCSQISALFDCSNLYVDVQSYTSFSAVTIDDHIKNGSFDTSSLGYSPGNPGDIVVVRLFYPWQLVVTGLGYNISNITGNKRLLIATMAFKNEPYK